MRAAGLPTAPGSIIETTGTRTGHSIGLQWTAPSSDEGSAIVSYTLVQVRENRDDETVYYGTGLSTIVSDLVAGQEYSFRVKATNLVGDGAWSSIYKFLNVDRPSEPLNLHLDSFDNTYVTFSWEQPIYNGGQALSGFKVYR